MGKGARISIKNQSSQSVSVSYSNFVCMYKNGDQGSDFRPITGTIAPSKALPASGTQYIEAQASPSCWFTTSSVDVRFTTPEGTLIFQLQERDNSWYVEHREIVKLGIQVKAEITSGSQYSITLIIADHAWAYTSWMGDLSGKIGNRALNMLAIPGTHDSATYDINALSLVANTPDMSPWVNAVYGLGLAGIVTAAIIAGWAKAQGLSTKKQLEAGIRYLDLRVVRDKSSYYICHAMYSCKVDEVIKEVKAFIEAHPKEIIILDFNHLYQFDTDTQHKNFVNKLYDTFGNKMAPNTLTSTDTLNTFWKSNYQIIALYDNDNVVSSNSLNPDKRLWSQNQIKSPWPETTDEKVLHTKLKEGIASRPTDKFYVTQGIFTPDAEMIGKGLVPGFPGSLEAVAGKITPKVCDWVKEFADAGNKINIVIVDWFNCVGMDYINTVVNLNLRG